MDAATVKEPANNSLLDVGALQSNLERSANSVNNEVKKKVNREDLRYYYSAGDFHFILEKGFKPETFEVRELTQVPFLPKWYDGIISIHGMIIPVVNMFKFVNTQNLKVINTNKDKKKNYLLKIEPADHRPLVLKLNSIPQLVNVKELKTSDKSDNSPEWIKSYHENDDIKIAAIDHDKLFDQLILQQ